MADTLIRKPKEKKPVRSLASIQFTHTLENLESLVSGVQYVELDSLSGFLTSEEIMILKSSTSNVILYANRKYEYSNSVDNLYYYICSYSVKGTLVANEFIINVDTGEYRHQELNKPASTTKPQQPPKHEHCHCEPHVCTKVNLKDAFIYGSLNEEDINTEDLVRLQDSLPLIKPHFKVNVDLREDSYIWFVCDYPIESITHIGGIDIDFVFVKEQEQTIPCRKSRYFYRTTYRLLASHWSFDVEYKEKKKCK